MADKYLDLLLDGLAEGSQTPLYSPLGQAWGANAKAILPGGKLRIEADGVLPGGANAGAEKWTEEKNFVSGLYANHEAAANYTAFHLARAYGSRQGLPKDQTISRFDKNRLAAAVALCDKVSPQKYLLVKGGLGGIQTYLYKNIGADQIGEAKRVGKRLRGRSFLIALLGELVAERLVDSLGLESANILFVGGGHFNLLLPDTEQTREDLDEFIWRVNRDFLAANNELYIIHGVTQVNPDDFIDFGSKFLEATDAMDRAKQKRYGKHLVREVVFGYRRVFPDPKDDTSRDEQERIRTNMEYLGSQVPKAEWLLEVAGKDRAKLRSGLSNLGRYFPVPGLDVDLHFFDEEQTGSSDVFRALENLNVPVSVDLVVRLQRLNDANFLPGPAHHAGLSKQAIGYGFRFVGRHTPVYITDTEEHKAGEIMELSDLAALGRCDTATAAQDKSLGYAQLGALRLDIDDLGALFRFGLGEKTSLIHTLGLSREVQVFFGGYFNSIAKAHGVYTIYSGGDDAFVLGSWINLLYFQQRLRDDLARFSGNNREVSVSGGIFVCNPKYPIARLHENAGDAEQAAKNFPEAKPPTDKEKNAVHVFGHTLSGDRFKEMLDFAERLLRVVDPANPQLPQPRTSDTGVKRDDGRIRRSVLQMLVTTIQEARATRRAPLPLADGTYESGPTFELYRHLGRLHGMMSRRKVADNSLIQQMLREMSNGTGFEDYLLPLHYVLYATR